MVPDPEQYVNENADVLARIIKHSSDEFARALALAALVEYGNDPAVDEVVAEIKQLRDTDDRGE